MVLCIATFASNFGISYLDGQPSRGIRLFSNGQSFERRTSLSAKPGETD